MGILPMRLINQTTELKLQIFHNQQQYQFLHSKYSGTFEDISYEAPLTVKDNGNANYKYEIIEASLNNYKVRATAVVDFDGDGIFDVWEIDKNGNPEQIVKD